MKKTLNDIYFARKLKKKVRAGDLSRKDLKAYIEKRSGKKVYGVVQHFLKEDFKSFKKSAKGEKDFIVIDLGSFNRRFYKDSINVDIFQEGDTDLVWDITTRLPIKSNSVDFIACSAVLEHVNEPGKVISEMFRILKPGGRVWVDIPFLQPYHESPDDFYRFTLSGIRHMFKEFTIHRSGAIPGAGFTVHWILKEFKGVLEWEKLLNKKEYPQISKLLDKNNLANLENELQKFDDNCQRKYKDSLPHSFHITATGVFVYGEKLESRQLLRSLKRRVLRNGGVSIESN